MAHTAKRQRVVVPCGQEQAGLVTLAFEEEEWERGLRPPFQLPAAALEHCPYLTALAAWPTDARAEARGMTLHIPRTTPPLTPSAWRVLREALQLLPSREAQAVGSSALALARALEEGSLVADLQAAAAAMDYLFPGDSMPEALVRHMQALHRVIAQQPDMQPDAQLLPYMFPWLASFSSFSSFSSCSSFSSFSSSPRPTSSSRTSASAFNCVSVFPSPSPSTSPSPSLSLTASLTWRDFVATCVHAIAEGGMPPRYLVLPRQALRHMVHTALPAGPAAVVITMTQADSWRWLRDSLADGLGGGAAARRFLRCSSATVTGPWLWHLLLGAGRRFFQLPPAPVASGPRHRREPWDLIVLVPHTHWGEASWWTDVVALLAEDADPAAAVTWQPARATVSHPAWPCRLVLLCEPEAWDAVFMGAYPPASRARRVAPKMTGSTLIVTLDNLRACCADEAAEHLVPPWRFRPLEAAQGPDVPTWRMRGPECAAMAAANAAHMRRRRRPWDVVPFPPCHAWVQPPARVRQGMRGYWRVRLLSSVPRVLLPASDRGPQFVAQLIAFTEALRAAAAAMDAAVDCPDSAAIMPCRFVHYEHRAVLYASRCGVLMQAMVSEAPSRRGHAHERQVRGRVVWPLLRLFPAWEALQPRLLPMSPMSAASRAACARLAAADRRLLAWCECPEVLDGSYERLHPGGPLERACARADAREAAWDALIVMAQEAEAEAEAETEEEEALAEEEEAWEAEAKEAWLEAVATGAADSGSEGHPL